MRKPKLTRRQKQSICSKYKQRKATQDELASYYGVHRKTIWNALYEMGLTKPRKKIQVVPPVRDVIQIHGTTTGRIPLSKRVAV